MAVLLTESSRDFGGQERRLLTEASGLARRGRRVAVACPGDSQLFVRARAAGLPAFAVPMRASLHLPGLWALARSIRSFRPSVLYSHSGKDSWLAGVAGGALGVPLVRSRELLTPVRKASAYRLPQRVIACSEACRAQLVEAGVPAAKVAVLHPPVDRERFSHPPAGAREAVRKELSIGGGFPVILHAGGFRGEKRQEDLVRALALLSGFPSAVALFAGQGPLLEEVRGLADRLGVGGRTRFLGEREDLPALMAASDLFAFPSCLEPAGMGPMEAMAAGVPVVASRTGGIPEIVEEGVTGLLVPPLDPGELARAIARLAGDRELRERFGRAGRERAGRWDLSVHLDRLEELLGPG